MIFTDILALNARALNTERTLISARLDIAGKNKTITTHFDAKMVVIPIVQLAVEDNDTRTFVFDRRNGIAAVEMPYDDGIASIRDTCNGLIVKGNIFEGHGIFAGADPYTILKTIHGDIFECVVERAERSA